MYIYIHTYKCVCVTVNIPSMHHERCTSVARHRHVAVMARHHLSWLESRQKAWLKALAEEVVKQTKLSKLGWVNGFMSG